MIDCDKLIERKDLKKERCEEEERYRERKNGKERKTGVNFFFF